MTYRIVPFVLLAALLLWPVSASAQQADYLPYTWAEAEFSLLYPAAWEPPFPAERDGVPVLYLAQALTTLPEARPPEVLSLELLLTAGNDPAAALTGALARLDIVAEMAAEVATLAGTEAVSAAGTSTDGALYGLGRAVLLDNGQILVVIGRGGADQRSLLRAIFARVADSVTPGVFAFEPPPVYGVAWYSQRSLADGPDAFLNLIGLAYADEKLYTYERDLGLVRLDAMTGAIETVTPNANITEPASVAAASDGTVYVADTHCACVFPLLPDGEWGEPLTGPLAVGSARSIATAGSTLYATGVDDTGQVAVYRLLTGQFTDRVTLDAGIFEQPALATAPDGAVLALTQYGTVIDISGDGGTRFQFGAAPSAVTGFAITSDGRFVLATPHQGVLVLDETGTPVSQPGRLVPGFPFPGELVSPVALVAGPDDTLYVADSDGSFGAVTAFSTRIAPGRIGTTALTMGMAAQGTLDEQTPQQVWTYVAAGGERISVFAVDASESGQLWPAVRLLAPDGRELGYAAYTGLDPDNPTIEALLFFGAAVDDVTLAQAGIYIIVVERVEGSGPYTVGVNPIREFALEGGTAARSGDLSAAFPVERWVFEGEVGQGITITMRPTSGTLDPRLRLTDADGIVLAENDDAEDTALGTSAQIARVTLPRTGTYTIEAARFSGAGGYELVVVETVPGE